MHIDSKHSDAQWVRVTEMTREAVTFYLDGMALSALAGDSVLTAILVNRSRLRKTEFSQEPRAGFCVIGACQDCWIWQEDGARLRACTTRLVPGMRLRSSATLASGGEV